MGFIRGAQISVGPVALEGGPIGATTMNPPPGTPRWGAAYRDFFAKYYARHAAIAAQIEDLPYPHQTIDLDPDMRDQWGLPALRVTYDSRRPNEVARTGIHEPQDGRDGPRDAGGPCLAFGRDGRRPPGGIIWAGHAWVPTRKARW